MASCRNTSLKNNPQSLGTFRTQVLPVDLPPIDPFCIRTTPQTIDQIIEASTLTRTQKDAWLSSDINFYLFLTDPAGLEVYYGLSAWGSPTDCGIPARTPLYIAGTSQETILFQADADICGKLLPMCGPKTADGVFNADNETTQIDIPPFELGIEGGVVQTKYCDGSGNPIFLCKITDEITGDSVFTPHTIDLATATVSPYAGPLELCPPEDKTLVLVPGWQATDNCAPVWKCVDPALQPGPTEYLTVDDTGAFEIVQHADVGPDAATSVYETYPFHCDLCPAAADETYTNADIIALLAGSTFPGGEPANSANACLCQLTITLAGVDAECPGGALSTTAQAVLTDAGSGKETDLDPSGSRTMEVPAGQDLPAISLLVAQGSKVLLSGCMTVRLDGKSGDVISK